MPDDHSSTLPIGGLSFVQGRTKLRLLNKTVGHCLEDVAQKYPDREALVVPLENVRLTFAQLKEEVGPDLNPKVDSCLLRLSWLCRAWRGASSHGLGGGAVRGHWLRL